MSDMTWLDKAQPRLGYTLSTYRYAAHLSFSSFHTLVNFVFCQSAVRRLSKHFPPTADVCLLPRVMCWLSRASKGSISDCSCQVTQAQALIFSHFQSLWMCHIKMVYDKSAELQLKIPLQPESIFPKSHHYKRENCSIVVLHIMKCWSMDVFRGKTFLDPKKTDLIAMWSPWAEWEINPRRGQWEKHDGGAAVGDTTTKKKKWKNKITFFLCMHQTSNSLNRRHLCHQLLNWSFSAQRCMKSCLSRPVREQREKTQIQKCLKENNQNSSNGVFISDSGPLSSGFLILRCSYSIKATKGCIVWTQLK